MNTLGRLSESQGSPPTLGLVNGANLWILHLCATLLAYRGGSLSARPLGSSNAALAAPESASVELTNAQYRAFIAERLKLPKGKRSEYIAQVDTLIDRFGRVAAEAPDIGVKRFRKTGSLWKGTVLRPRAGVSPDADVAVYIDIAQTPNVLDHLHGRIRRLLIKAYPTKSAADYTVQPRTLGIQFIASGLNVDLVPVIPTNAQNDFGHQPSSQGAPLVLTSIPGQLAFIEAHKAAYKDWSGLVRLLKRWRNQHELPLRSFAIELLVSYVQDMQGIPQSIEASLSRFWLFVARDLAGTVVSFSKAQGGQGAGKYEASLVVVIDPVNPDNNVTSRLTKAEAAEIAEAALEAWERLGEARTTAVKGATLDHLRAIFGNDFDFE